MGVVVLVVVVLKKLLCIIAHRVSGAALIIGSVGTF